MITQTQVKKYGPVPAEKHRKNPKTFRSEYCFKSSIDSGVFLQDPVIFPPLSSGIRSFPEAWIIDLGIKCYSISLYYITITWIIIRRVLYKKRYVCALVDDLASRLSRFLIFLVISQDSFAIPSMQDSCPKSQIWTFLWYSCVLVFLTDYFLLIILAWLLISWSSCLILFSQDSFLISFFSLYLVNMFI